MKTIKIHGKDYVEVKERVKYFRENYKDYSLTTDIIDFKEIEINGKVKLMVTMKSTVKDINGREISNGHAYEIKDSTHINKTSFIENCETSANGRALANLGIMIDDSIASADEVKMAIEVQENIKKTKSVKVKLSKDKFDAMKKAIKEGKKDIVKKKMLNYILTKKQETVLNGLLEEKITTVTDIMDKLDNTVADYHDVELYEMQQAEMNKLKTRINKNK